MAHCDRGDVAPNRTGSAAPFLSAIQSRLSRVERYAVSAGTGNASRHYVRVRFPRGRAAAIRRATRRVELRHRLPCTAIDTRDKRSLVAPLLLAGSSRRCAGNLGRAGKGDGCRRSSGAVGGRQHFRRYGRSPALRPPLSQEHEPRRALHRHGLRHGGHRRHGDGDLRDRPLAGSPRRDGPYSRRVSHQHSGCDPYCRSHGTAARRTHFWQAHAAAAGYEHDRRHYARHTRRTGIAPEHRRHADRSDRGRIACQSRAGPAAGIRRRAADAAAHAGMGDGSSGMAGGHPVAGSNHGRGADGHEDGAERVHCLPRYGTPAGRCPESTQPADHDLCPVRLREFRQPGHTHRWHGNDGAGTTGRDRCARHAFHRRRHAGDPDDRRSHRHLLRRPAVSGAPVLVSRNWEELLAVVRSQPEGRCLHGLPPPLAQAVLAAPAAVALWIGRRLPQLAALASVRLLVIGAETVDAVDGGRWYALGPFLAGGQGVAAVTLVGAELDPAFASDAAEHAPQPAARCERAHLREFLAVAARVDFDLAVVFHPGLPKHRGWLEDGSFARLLGANVPLVCAAFGKDDSEMDRWVVESYGYEPSGEAELNPFYLELPQDGAVARWGHALWQLDPRVVPVAGDPVDHTRLDALENLTRMVMHSMTEVGAPGLDPGAPVVLSSTAGSSLDLIHVFDNRFLDPASLRFLRMNPDGALEPCGQASAADLAAWPGAKGRSIERAVWAARL